MRIFAVVLLLFISSALRSQSAVFGNISDSVTGKPVAGVNVQVVGTIFGTTTGETGDFVLNGDISLPCKVLLSDIRYKRKVVELTGKGNNIVLAPNTTELPGVEIDGTEFLSISPGKYYYSYDFEFYNDLIFILAFKNTKDRSELFVTDPEGRIDTSFSIPRGAVCLKRDYADNIHLITDDSAYQLFYQDRKLYLLYPVEVHRFSYFVTPCITVFRDKIIRQRYDMNNLRVTFYASDQHSTSQFWSVMDTGSVNYRNRALPLGHFVTLRNLGDDRYGYSVTTLYNNLEILRNTADIDWTSQKYMVRASATILKLDEKKLALFDYTNGLAYTIKDGLKPENPQKIGFHKMPGNSRRLILDHKTKRLFTTNETGGITEVIELDTVDFRPLSRRRIENRLYIGKLIVWNNYIYFLYRDRLRETTRLLERVAF